jgi:hypothetical protein
MGKTKQLIEKLIWERSKGDPFMESSTRIKLLMKGIDPLKIDDDTPDDPEILKKVHEVADALNISIELETK